MFEIHRVSFDGDENRIQLTITVYPADRNRFRINVGKVPPRLADQAEESVPVTGAPELKPSG